MKSSTSQPNKTAEVAQSSDTDSSQESQAPSSPESNSHPDSDLPDVLDLWQDKLPPMDNMVAHRTSPPLLSPEKAPNPPAIPSKSPCDPTPNTPQASHDYPTEKSSHMTGELEFSKYPSTDDHHTDHMSLSPNEVEVLNRLTTVVSDPSTSNGHGLRKRIAKVSQKSAHLPQFLDPFYTKLVDVPSDGNCGFHVIAKQVSKGKKVTWRDVREDLLKEICNHGPYYTRLSGGAEALDQLMKKLQVGPGKSASPDNWLSRGDHGPIIANAYSQPVIFLTRDPDECMMFLPNRTSPAVSTTCRPITLVFVNGCHYMQIEYQKDVCIPYPPYPKHWESTNNTRWRALEWKNHVNVNLLLWNELNKD